MPQLRASPTMLWLQTSCANSPSYDTSKASMLFSTVFSYVSSNEMQSHIIGYICLTFLHSVFSNVSSNCKIHLCQNLELLQCCDSRLLVQILLQTTHQNSTVENIFFFIYVFPAEHILSQKFVSTLLNLI